MQSVEKKTDKWKKEKIKYVVLQIIWYLSLWKNEIIY